MIMWVGMRSDELQWLSATDHIPGMHSRCRREAHEVFGTAETGCRIIVESKSNERNIHPVH